METRRSAVATAAPVPREEEALQTEGASRPSARVDLDGRWCVTTRAETLETVGGWRGGWGKGVPRDFEFCALTACACFVSTL
jgi:hypothetical protein